MQLHRRDLSMMQRAQPQLCFGVALTVVRAIARYPDRIQFNETRSRLASNAVARTEEGLNILPTLQRGLQKSLCMSVLIQKRLGCFLLLLPAALCTTPNVHYLLSDDMRADWGTYGLPVHTPNVDALAKSSLTFEHAYCQLSVCSPSRQSFMTSKRPDTNKVWNFIDANPLSTQATPGHAPWAAPKRMYDLYDESSIAVPTNKVLGEGTPLIAWSPELSVRLANGTHSHMDLTNLSRTGSRETIGTPTTQLCPTSMSTSVPSSKCSMMKVFERTPSLCSTVIMDMPWENTGNGKRRAISI